MVCPSQSDAKDHTGSQRRSSEQGRAVKKLDQAFLLRMLQSLEDGERYGLSPDRFAEIFPPGYLDAAVLERARRFADAHRCVMEYWPATNEVFFMKMPRRSKQG
jgi:hypothetical protein